MNPTERSGPADTGSFRAVVLAGERSPDGLGVAFDVPAKVLVPVAGLPSLARVLAALSGSRAVSTGVVSGPAAAVVESDPQLADLLSGRFTWTAPQSGPAASSLAALKPLAMPVLITAGDHALLTGGIVDAFCDGATARADAADFVVGLVPYAAVEARFPNSRRTVLRFSDVPACGANLYAVLTAAGRAALEFWRNLETYRKQPWRIAGALGMVTLLRYAMGRLSVDQAFAALSARAGCRVGYVLLEDARAAVDVDSEADHRLAEEVLGKT